MDEAASELQARMLALPTPKERAALLGLSYESIRATAVQLYVANVFLLAAAAVAVLFAGTYILELSDFSEVDIGAVAGGLLHGFAAQLGPFVLVTILARIVDKSLSTRASQLLLTVSFHALVAGVLVGGIGLFPADLQAVFGILLGNILGSVVSIIGVNSLEIGLRKNLRGVVDVYNQHATLPAWQTLLGGQARWLVLENALHVTAQSAVIVAAFASLAAGGVTGVVYVVGSTLAVAASLVGRRSRSFVILGAATSVLIVATTASVFLS